MVVNRVELFCTAGRNHCVSLQNRAEMISLQAVIFRFHRDLCTKGKWTHISKNYFPHGLPAFLHGTLYGGTQSNCLIRIDAGIRHPSEQTPHELADSGHFCGSTHQYHLVNIPESHTGIGKTSSHRLTNPLKQGLCFFLEFFSADICLQFFPVFYGLHQKTAVSGDGTFCFFRLVPVIGQLLGTEFPFLYMVLFQECIKNYRSKIFSAQIIVSSHSPDFHNIIIQLKNGYIKGTSAQVKYQKSGIFFSLAQSIGYGCCRRFTDNSLHFQTGHFSGPFRRFSFNIIKICRNADDRFLYRFPKKIFGIFF